MRQFLPVRHAQQRVIPELAAGKIGRNHAPVFAQNHFLVSRRRAVGAVSTRRRDFCAIGRLFEHPLSSNTARFWRGGPPGANPPLAPTRGERGDSTRRVRETERDVHYVVEPKIDGLSVSLEYTNGVLTRGSTRGDGDVGEDVTANLRTVRSIPLKIKTPLPFLEVRGEVYMPKSVFASLVTRQELDGEKPFKNPRNAAAGAPRAGGDSSADAGRCRRCRAWAGRIRRR